MLPPTDSVCNIGVRLSRLVGVCIRQTILPLLSTASPYAACPALVMQHHCQLIYRCHCRIHVPGNVEEPRPIAQDRFVFCAAWYSFCFVLFCFENKAWTMRNWLKAPAAKTHLDWSPTSPAVLLDKVESVSTNLWVFNCSKISISLACSTVWQM